VEEGAEWCSSTQKDWAAYRLLSTSSASTSTRCTLRPEEQAKCWPSAETAMLETLCPALVLQVQGQSGNGLDF